ncbi:MAG: primosomal protein N' [Bacteroidetes bacterium]|nr:primosomal protein N' [Bacteroidota bacterium]MBL7105097.1 primosomal protein N' [Bacteroidales bacterium]
MERTTLFADVMLPLPVPGLFTYRVPFDLNDSVEKWRRVVVQFGKKKIYTAIVIKIHQTPPQNYRVKYILSVLDNEPVMNNIQYDFWNWISEYYMCEPGEVMNVAIPSALKLASESKIVLNPEFKGDYDSLTEKEYLVAEALDIQKQLTLSEIENIIEQKKVIPLIKNLIEKEVVLIEEELKERYKPKTETFIRLSEEYKNQEKLQDLFNQLEKRAFKQLEVLMAFINLSDFGHSKEKEIKQAELVKQIKNATSAINSLAKKGIFETYRKTTSRLEYFDASAKPESIILNEYQQQALTEIKSAFEKKSVVLFHGITSSGKTEIYIKLIEEVLKQDKQVLYLLPEIALTTQIINRLRKYFGNKVGVYHSKYNENERVEIWNNVINSKLKKSTYKIILGPRSALFLPYNNLGLVIIDEEHDYSYKQFDPAPRYNARDSAIYLACMHGAKVLLGSATPSIESYYNAKSGKYTLVELNKRFGDIRLPEIFVADLKKETRQKTMKSHFSSLLLNYVTEVLKNKEQVILFQNRRGFSLRLECDTCNWMPECKNCDVTLIYHKHFNQLRCHYCGYSRRVPERCDSCGSTHLHMRGFGTEKVEDELSILYPEARIRRMDLDTTRSKHAYQNIINDFEERRIDILVGTQMVTKGLDFDNVNVVGILNADNMISFPDFRSYERSFQLMAQVSGRAGRKNKRGKVVIQSYNPNHSVIRDVIQHDYLSMYQSQILERRNFKYPPFNRLIRISMKHKDARILNETAREFATMLRDKLGKRILGPEYPLVSRIKNLYIKNILVKLEKSENLNEHKKEILKTIDIFKSESGYKAVRIYLDVDPI